MASTLPPGVRIVHLSGPLLIGYLVDWALFAVLTVQTYLYYQAFPGDQLWIKCLVYIVYSIDLVQITFGTLDVFKMFGYHFGDVSVLTEIHFAWLTGPTLTGLVSFIVQSFYAFRLYKLSGSRVVPALITVVSVAASVSGFVTGGLVLKAGDITKLNTPVISTVVGVWLAGSALNDIIIAVCMTYYLAINDTGFRQTHALVTKLIRLTIETGSLTALVALTTLILFGAIPGTVYYTTPANFMSVLYANTLLAVLNARFQILGGRSAYTSADIMISIPEHLHDVRTRPIVSITRAQFLSVDAPIEMKPVNVRRSPNLTAQPNPKN
ncbi:hypothetical protein B0H11DRAFT_1881780 [Mycena galericulata]|nr:hypothetical protein B0H11DRAFT_1881780 [Mycena galericulata]